MSNSQGKLFDTPQRLTNGLVYRPDFITKEEEEILLIMIEHLPMRRTKHEIKEIGESVLDGKRSAWFKDPLPRWLLSLQKRISKWLDIPHRRIPSVLINEYKKGDRMGFHRDDGAIDHIVGISLGSRSVMRFRPYTLQSKNDIVELELEPRSAYIMQGEVRHYWQHSVMPVPSLRYSLTFRTTPLGTIPVRSMN